MPRSAYAVIGLFAGAVVDLLVNLLATAIQQRAFPGQFSTSSILWLAGLAILGLLVGYWLGGPVHLPASPSVQTAPRRTTTGVTITRFKALLSYGQLRGKGITLSDILLVGSRLDIDTWD
jgi:hypothetical protein